MLTAFLFVFITIYLSQMGDKTQILTIFLAAKTRKSMILFLGVMTGFAVSVTLASIFGAGISSFTPHHILKIVTGLIFIALGITMFLSGRKKAKNPKKLKANHHFLSIALLIFLADFGDKTQISVALLSIDYSPFLVFLAAMAALATDTILVIFFSKTISKRFKESTIKKIAGGVFSSVGVYLLTTSLNF